MQFKCDCATSQTAQQFLKGAVDKDTLRRAVRYHINHACPDFMIAHDLLFKEASLKDGKIKWVDKATNTNKL